MNFAYREEVRPRQALSVEHRQRTFVRNDCARSIALIACAIAVQSVRRGPPTRGRHTWFWSWTVRMIEAPASSILSCPLLSFFCSAAPWRANSKHPCWRRDHLQGQRSWRGRR